MGERFMLTNAQRRYVGLNPVEAHWDVMDIKGTLYYFEGDTIRKEISTSDSGEGPFYYPVRASWMSKRQKTRRYRSGLRVSAVRLDMSGAHAVRIQDARGRGLVSQGLPQGR